MGVHGIWELLAPVGRRVSVETLAGKKLAIDASIWMVQFMKAMRDEKGEMVRNAHLLGFFRRICKLLFLRTKPVFVFDGGTPALKRRTVIARRRQRENAQAKIRKMAEKLLLNHLKSMRLKELAKDVENQRKKNNAKGKKVLSNQSEVSSDYGKLSNDQEKVDEMLAASLAAEEEGRLANAPSTSNAGTSVDEDDEIEEIILPEVIENLDPAILEALPLELVAQIQGRSGFGDKGKQVLSGKDGKLGGNLDGSDVGSKIRSQEELDEILSASLAAEEGWKVSDYGLASDSQDHFEAEDHEADEEMIIPEVHGNVDRDVLDSLPISMRLDLLAQMRERQMAENRQKYQKLKKAPEKFSELQIQSYLKAVSLRHEINQAQKAAAGRGVGGVQTSRIASEANREFIFSSAFSGNKEILTSSGAQTSKSREDQSNMEPHSMNSAPGFPSTNKANSMKELIANKSKKAFNHGVETFLDERGRVRVSRVRAMGIRMTRDLQRNLELMKEIDQDPLMRDRRASDVGNAETMLSENNIGGTDNNLTELSGSADCSSIDLNGNNQNFVFGKEASIQISFEDAGETKSFDEDDQIFASLVAEKPLTLLSAEKVTAGKESSDSESIDWQEGEGNSFSGTGKVDELVPGKSNDNEESDVEWEEGFHDISKDSSSCPDGCRKHWKGDQQEDADLQEAIRRSLKEQKSYTASEKDMEQERNGETNLLSTKFVGVSSIPMKKILPETAECAPQVEANFAKLDVGSDIVYHDSNGIDSVDTEMQQESHKGHNLDYSGALTNEGDKCQGSSSEQDSCLMGGLSGELVAETTVLLDKEQVRALADASAVQCGLFAHMEKHLKGDPCDRAFVNSCDGIIANDKMHKEDAVELQAITEESCLPSNPMLPCSSKLMEADVGELKVECNQVDSSTGRMHSIPDFPNKDHGDAEVELTKENLEEEIQKLDQEYINLGNEQKKLERTAESVNSEMFTECQELLQMFGLPYIIAPMEAEAQCAYMELANLVDGVVTDDSDVFLFGARSVYKNIFDDRKYVETYFMKDIEKELGLTREKLIRMALLLGSDYTEGISGIGIVNAIEVVNAFPEENGLQKFREWVESPDPSILGKGSKQRASTLRKRGSNTCSNGKNISKDTTEGLLSSEKVSSSDEQENLADQIDEMKEHFMNKHRNVSKNWHIPASFPSEAVISAYTFPQVDKSTEPFSWGRPDHFVLSKLCWEKFGWGSQKADELLVPVLNEYNKHETQLRLEAFYSFNERFAKIRSKRIKQAVKGITGSQAPGLMDDDEQKVQSTKKQKKGPDQPRSEKSKVSSKNVSNEAEIWDPLDSVESTRSASKLPGGSSNCRGRGRGRGRKEGVTMRKRKAAHVRTDMSSSDTSSNDDENEVLDDKLKGRQVRKSARTRKQVCYIENEVEEDAFKPAENCCDSSYNVLVATQDSVSTQGTSGKNIDCQHHTDGDLLQDSFSTDYLKMGGGFCLDEDDTDKQQLCNDDGSLPGTYKGHNLEMDGDLCMDEANAVEEACGVSNKAVDDALTSQCLAYPENETHETNSVQSASTPWLRPDEAHDHMRVETSAEHHLDHLNTANNDSLASATSLQEDKTKENFPISYGALSAMPFLRKKKRTT